MRHARRLVLLAALAAGVVGGWTSAHAESSSPHAALRQHTSPATVIGPEFPASDPVYGPALNDQAYPEIASKGDEYFTVWEDGRLGDSIFGS